MLPTYLAIVLSIFSFFKLNACEVNHGQSENKYKGLRDGKNITYEGRIVGGVSASLMSFPYSVQFFNAGGLCGGVILNSWTILTCAHCFDANKNVNEMIVRAGSKYIYDYNSDTYRVRSVVLHEDYNKEQVFACDIALIFLQTPLKLGPLAKKGILVNHDKWMNEQGNKFVAAGWGTTEYNGVISNNLLKTSLYFVPSDECSRLHNNYRLTKDMFCLYGNGTQDTCKGDSGGGIMWKNVMVGLTSHGNKCAGKNSPSIYTNLWYFRSWIKTKVTDFFERYCD